MKAGALALAILLAAPGCSAEAEAPARSAEAQRIADLLPARPAGPVLDQADVLPAGSEDELARRLSDYWTRTHTAVVVASVTSLDGVPIEQYSLEMARSWDIGDARTLRGLLVLVAPNERRVRIEVSCGLENVVTDVFAGQVIREHMTPRFTQGDLGGGTLAGVDALIARLDAGANPAPVSDSCRASMKDAA